MKDRMQALSRDSEEGQVILAPTVGRYLSPPPAGTFLSPGSVLGDLRILNRVYQLTVPAGVSGVVREVFTSGRAAPVEHGQPILSVGAAADPLAGGSEGAAGPSAAVGEEVPEGMIAITSPTDGIFYRRPSPDEPSYVDEGDVVERGKVLGLVEVMKCFNQIAWGSDPDAPPRVKVHRILPEDAGEVKLDQVLFILDPR